MIPEEMQRTMQFLLENQAAHDARLAAIEINLDKLSIQTSEEYRKLRPRSKLPPKKSMATMAVVITSASENSVRESSRCCMALSRSSMKQYIASVRSWGNNHVGYL
jgi:hypothetical protein